MQDSRRNRGFASRVKGLFGFTPSKDGKTDRPHRSPSPKVTHTTVEELPFRKFELPTMKMEIESDDDDKMSTLSKGRSPQRISPKQDPAGVTSPSYSAVDGLGSSSKKGSAPWDASLPQDFSSTPTIIASASASKFDNSKFREYNAFGTPGQKTMPASLMETQSMPGFIDDDSMTPISNHTRQPMVKSSVQNTLDTVVDTASRSMLDDLDEDLMDSILAD